MSIQDVRGPILWEPTKERQEKSMINLYMKWLNENQDQKFSSYNDLWKWSTRDIEGFWQSIWNYFDVIASQGYDKVISERKMPGVKWFEGAKLNYTEHIFRNLNLETPAVLSQSEIRPLETWSWKKLYSEVASFAKGLRSLGIKKGDRIAAYMPNIPEALVAFLACASIGAIWSVASPDFGGETVVSRMKQIEPKLLITVDGYRFAGKNFLRIDEVKYIKKDIPTIKHTIMLPYLTKNSLERTDLYDYTWREIIETNRTEDLFYEQVDFEHPLWILYSSGTTGIPKAIVQGHGNILLEQYKALSLQMDLKAGKRFFWYTTTGWMIWNMLISGLLVGSTVVLYDGSPTSPSPDVLWKFIEDVKLNIFGTSPPFLLTTKQLGINPKKDYNLESLDSIVYTGSPLSEEMFNWVYAEVKKDIWLGSASGGTDVCSGFVMPSPLHPVRAGEIQCLALGAKVAAYNDKGEAVVGEVGELVIEEPMPSMPLYFWNDESGERYFESYFDEFPGVWTHGDWIKIYSDGGNQIFGRSDSTINRGGIRMGTSEIYRVVESIPGVTDSLVVDISGMDGSGEIKLFLVLQENVELDICLINRIKQEMRARCSPRHVPDTFHEIDEVPRTLNGKKLEVPIKRLLSGGKLSKVINRGSMSNPETLDYFIELANDL